MFAQLLSAKNSLFLLATTFHSRQHFLHKKTQWLGMYQSSSKSPPGRHNVVLLSVSDFSLNSSRLEQIPLTNQDLHNMFSNDGILID